MYSQEANAEAAEAAAPEDPPAEHAHDHHDHDHNDHDHHEHDQHDHDHHAHEHGADCNHGHDGDGNGDGDGAHDHDHHDHDHHDHDHGHGHGHGHAAPKKSSDGGVSSEIWMKAIGSTALISLAPILMLVSAIMFIFYIYSSLFKKKNLHRYPCLCRIRISLQPSNS